ncbi:uncharacterized protein LOC128344014 [Hemicordylus capensis]|uniref:uncharacterized protein LOC128344014 n=1 Tax=Hemicordylus capensis TaxID=884348 RepID=UPI002304A101|nr:uncharacterized protein LOC128344014 [Hemicordylus capensis]
MKQAVRRLRVPLPLRPLARLCRRCGRRLASAAAACSPPPARLHSPAQPGPPPRLRGPARPADTPPQPGPARRLASVARPGQARLAPRPWPPPLPLFSQVCRQDQSGAPWSPRMRRTPARDTDAGDTDAD